MTDYDALLKRIGQRLFEIEGARQAIGGLRAHHARKELLDVLTCEETAAVLQYEREASA